MGFAEKIIREKITQKISWIDSGHGLRKFDPKCDRVHFTVSGRQWEYIQRLCWKNHVYNKYELQVPVDGYSVYFRYNDRFNAWEGYATHASYRGL